MDHETWKVFETPPKGIKLLGRSIDGHCLLEMHPLAIFEFRLCDPGAPPLGNGRLKSALHLSPQF
jgi:hypothetical protein